MQSIYKFKLQPNANSVSIIQIQKGAQILHVAYQGSDFQVWALIDKDAKLTNRIFFIFGTGWEIGKNESFDNLKFVGTVFTGPLVFHVFDGGEV